MIIEALTKGGLLPPELSDWLRRREQLVQRFGLNAIELTRVEGWRTDIIAETARRLLAEDSEWRDAYCAMIEAAPYDRVKAKERVNPMLGRRVKVLTGATTGKVFQVPQPSIFTSASHLLEPPPKLSVAA